MTKRLKTYINKKLEKKKYLKVIRESRVIEDYFFGLVSDEDIAFYKTINTLSNIENVDYYEILKLTDHDDFFTNSQLMYRKDASLIPDLFLLSLVTKLNTRLKKEDFNNLKEIYKGMNKSKDDIIFSLIEEVFEILKEQII